MSAKKAWGGGRSERGIWNLNRDITFTALPIDVEEESVREKLVTPSISQRWFEQNVMFQKGYHVTTAIII